MNSISKKMLLALTILSISKSASAYTWTFNNKTDKPVIVEMMLIADLPMNQRYFRIIEPGRPGKFEFVGIKGGYCYRSIRVTEWDVQDVQKYANEYKLNTADRNELLSAPKIDLYPVSSKPVLFYIWDYIIFHTPEIVYVKSAFDTNKIVSALKAIGNSTEKAAELIAKAAAAPATGGASAAVPSLDLGLKKLIESTTGLVLESIAKGSCRDRIFDLYGTEVSVPGTKKTENAYIFVTREN